MPVRNAENTLRGEVESLLEVLPELTDRFEIIVVDDGSSDHTWEAAAELSRKFPQVRVMRNEHPLGRAAALDAARCALRPIWYSRWRKRRAIKRLRSQWQRHKISESSLPQLQAGPGPLRAELIRTPLPLG